jgi:hypothetical protein
MTLYHFQMIDPTGGRRDMKTVELGDMTAVWREIGALAFAHASKGGQIRVKNESGGIVVLVGVSTAISLFPALLARAA